MDAESLSFHCWQTFVHKQLLERGIQHISGPQHISYTLDELIVICLVRNGEFYLHSFLEHHRSMGVKHFVFLDNGSTDSTIPRLCHEPDVSVFQSHLPFKLYQYLMRQWLLRFGRGRWILYADIDELFDYPLSDRISLSTFLHYLTEHRYTAVTSHFVDMFSDQPISQLKSTASDSLRNRYPYYDLSNIDQRIWSPGTPDQVRYFCGGIRRTVFGCETNLTTHRLFFLDGKLKAFRQNTHFLTNANFADVTSAVLHYKFLSNFTENVREAVQKRHYWRESSEYRNYHDILQAHPDLCLTQPTSRFLKNTNELIEQGYITISEEYKQWVQQHELNSSSC